MRYLLASGSRSAAVPFTEDLRAAFAAAEHQETGPPVPFGHHLADAAGASDAEAVVVARTLAGDLPVAEAVVAPRQALSRARIVVLLGTPDEQARELARPVAHGAAVFDLLPGAVRSRDVPASLGSPRRTYQDVRDLIETPTAPRAEGTGGGPVVAVLGAAPGCGGSTVAAHVCFLLAGAGHAVEALDLRAYPGLAVLPHADHPPGGSRRQVGPRDVDVTERSPSEDAVELSAATARRARWTICLPSPDPRDPRPAAALVAAQAVWLVVTPEPWTVQAAAGWLRDGWVREPQRAPLAATGTHPQGGAESHRRVHTGR